MLEVPVSLVSLIDRHRQFFKSQCGLPEPWASACQTPLSHSLCQHVVATGRPLIIEDAWRTPLVADTLAVRNIPAVAYAGVPLVLADGHAVGTLCAVDTEPRHWSDRDLRILGDLAAAQALIDLRCSIAPQRLHDRLTGLPSRALAVANAEQTATRLGAGELLAVAAGVNDLGAVNPGYGTLQGDRILTGFEALARWEHPELGAVGGQPLADPARGAQPQRGAARHPARQPPAPARARA